ncbi:MAG: hypothetical protein ACE368_18280 [Paracoccaceae bacterium]
MIGIWLVAVFAVFASDRGAEAQTYTLEVGGTSYSVTLLPFGDSFDDNEGTLVTTPWYGDQTLAEGLAQAVIDLAVLGPLTALTDRIQFAHSSDGTFVTSSEAIEGFANPFTSTRFESNNSVGLAYASGFAIPAVPEIDGNALAKALFILFALGAWLDMRRRRLAHGDA